VHLLGFCSFISVMKTIKSRLSLLSWNWSFRWGMRPRIGWMFEWLSVLFRQFEIFSNRKWLSLMFCYQLLFGSRCGMVHSWCNISLFWGNQSFFATLRQHFVRSVKDCLWHCMSRFRGNVFECHTSCPW
jgi:hypothetical protein